MKKSNLLIGAAIATVGFAAGTLAVTQFTDVPTDHYAYNAIEWANSEGIVKGYEGDRKGEFGPNESVTRGQVALMLQRYHQSVDMMDEAEMKKMMEDMMMEMMEEETKEEEMTKKTVKVSNLSDYTLSPGVLVVHTDAVSLIPEDMMATAEWEPLAEWGDPTDLAAMLEEVEGVSAVYTTDAMPTGEMGSWMLEMGEDQHLSFAAMVVESNDSLAVVTDVPFTEGEMAMGMVYDAGTEENSDLGTGFDGGQPDSEKTAEENMNNGTATDPQAKIMLDDRFDGMDVVKLMVE